MFSEKLSAILTATRPQDVEFSVKLLVSAAQAVGMELLGADHPEIHRMRNEGEIGLVKWGEELPAEEEPQRKWWQRSPVAPKPRMAHHAFGAPTSPRVEWRAQIEAASVSWLPTINLWENWSSSCGVISTEIEAALKAEILRRLSLEAIKVALPEAAVVLPVPSWMVEGSCGCGWGGGLISTTMLMSEAAEAIRGLVDEARGLGVPV